MIMQYTYIKSFYAMTSFIVTSLTSFIVTSAIVLTISVVLTLPSVSTDLTRDAIAPSSDRFPSFAMTGHHRNPNLISSSHLPRRGHLKPEILLKKLGSDFDSSWMSVEKPATTNASLPKTSIENELYEDLDNVNFTYRDEVTGEEKVVKPLVRKYLERWLVQRASCPVRMTWVDIGILFWPRWIRKGTCDDDSSSASSCSWPPGMHCVAKPHRPIRVLHWTCQARHKSATATTSGTNGNEDKGRTVENKRVGLKRDSGKDKFRCRWKKTRYQITSECVCSC